MLNSNEATLVQLKDYTDKPRTGVLRRDVFEAKFGNEEVEEAFQLYDVITQWHPSWSELFSYSSIQKVLHKTKNQRGVEDFLNLPENFQQSLISVIGKCSRHSFQQLLTVMLRMNSLNFAGRTGLLLDMRHLFGSEPRYFVKREYLSQELYDLIEQSSTYPIPNHVFVYIIAASRLYGESNVIEVLQCEQEQGLSHLDLVKILSQWEEMREYPLKWIVYFAQDKAEK